MLCREMTLRLSSAIRVPVAWKLVISRSRTPWRTGNRSCHRCEPSNRWADTEVYGERFPEPEVTRRDNSAPSPPDQDTRPRLASN